jgi:hypothetical protein
VNLFALPRTVYRGGKVKSFSRRIRARALQTVARIEQREIRGRPTSGNAHPGFRCAQPGLRRREGGGASKDATVLQCPRHTCECCHSPMLGARRAPQTSRRSLRHSSAFGARSPSDAPPRHSPAQSQPHLAQPQNRVSRGRPRPGVLPAFAHFWLSPFWLVPLAAVKRAPRGPRLNALRVDRSFCRSTGAPGPPGSGVTKPARGDRVLLHQRPSPVTPSNEQGFSS